MISAFVGSALILGVGCVNYDDPVVYPEEAQAMHAFVRAQLGQIVPDQAPDMRILYGGSMNADNAQGLLAQPDIDGGLVGGASLEAAQFLEIVRMGADLVSG